MRTTIPLTTPFRSEVRINGHIYEITAVAVIYENGVTFNEIVLPPGVHVPASDGGRMIVPNAHLLYMDGNNAGRSYRRIRKDKSVTYHKNPPKLDEGDKLFKWFIFSWKEQT